MELPIVTFVSDELVKCEIAGIFFDNIKYTSVVVYMKEYDQDNSTIVYKSNSLPLSFQPQNIIWTTYNLSEVYFYLQKNNQILPLSSNIKMQPLSDYYCVFGSNEYLTNATFA